MGWEIDENKSPVLIGAKCIKSSKSKDKIKNLYYDFAGDKSALHSIMSQIDAAYSQPFPSPDHTYAISPAKEDREEAVKTEPPDIDQDQEETQPTYRGRVS